MAGMKEIRTRIDSVQQTLKITNAMYLISSSKLRKARQQLNKVEPFFTRITETIADILHHSTETSTCILTSAGTSPRRSGRSATWSSPATRAWRGPITTMSSASPMEKLAQASHPVLFLVGQVGRIYFANRGIPVDNEFSTPPRTHPGPGGEMSDYFIQRFLDGELDEVYVVYTEMVTSMLLEPRVRKMLPLGRRFLRVGAPAGGGGPEPAEGHLCPQRGAGAQLPGPGVYQGGRLRHPGGVLLRRAERPYDGHGLLQQQRPGHAQELSLHYNRARQAAITQEITEVVGGAQRGAPERPPPPGGETGRSVRFLADGSRP